MNAPIEYLCPNCRRSLYDRTLTRCGYCASAIPEELRFSGAELTKREDERKKWEESVARGGLTVSKPPLVIAKSDDPGGTWMLGP